MHRDSTNVLPDFMITRGTNPEERSQILHTVTSPAPQIQERKRDITLTALELFVCCICLPQVSGLIPYPVAVSLQVAEPAWMDIRHSCDLRKN